MDAAAVAAPDTGKKSKAWKWVIGVLIVALAAFLALGRSVSNEYEAAVKREIRAPGSQVSFNGVTRYKSGVVCGMVSNHPAGWQRFVVDQAGQAAIDDGAGPASQVAFNALSDRLCKE